MKGDQWFAQIVGPGEMFERKILASEFGIGRDGAIVNAMEKAGVNILEDPVANVPFLPAPEVPAGIIALLKTVEDEVERLIYGVRAFRD